MANVHAVINVFNIGNVNELDSGNKYLKMAPYTANL